jgi:hypothetical protein
MPAGTHGKTSTIFYRRGVPYNFKDFGLVATGNYTAFQPTTQIYNSAFFRRNISNVIGVYKGN